ncbi:MAG: NAD(P)-binding protein [Verrucomicrobiota bacterium]
MESSKSGGELQKASEAVPVAIIGAGPAGLTAGYLLSKRNVSVVIFEADSESVGGIARTVNFAGYSFDLGRDGDHSASGAEMQWLENIFGESDFQQFEQHLVFWNHNSLPLPLNPAKVLLDAGPWHTLACVASWLKARVFPNFAPRNLEGWLSNEWGRRFFSLVFKTHAEKVWGLDCSEIPLEWGTRQIGNCRISQWIGRRLLLAEKPAIHPLQKPGLWEKCADRIIALGGRILMGERVTRCAYDARRGTWRLRFGHRGDREGSLLAEHLVSSAPLPALLRALQPRVSEDAFAAGATLRFRDKVTVALAAEDRNGLVGAASPPLHPSFGKRLEAASTKEGRAKPVRLKLSQIIDEPWLSDEPEPGTAEVPTCDACAGNQRIDIYDPEIKAARLRILRPDVEKNAARKDATCFLLEYFCFEGDALAVSRDEILLEIAQRDLKQMGFVDSGPMQAGRVIRQSKVFPIEETVCSRGMAKLRQELGKSFPTLHLVGCNGLHINRGRDHAPKSAALCVENIIAGRPVHDLWACSRAPERLGIERVRTKKAPRIRPPTPGLAPSRRRIGPPQPA